MPTVTITSPTGSPTQGHSSVNVIGTATDDDGVWFVTAQINGGGRVLMSGTTSWNKIVPIGKGSNSIVLTSHDYEGNTSTTDTEAVTYTPATANTFLTSLKAYWALEEGAPSRLDSHTGSVSIDVETGTVTVTTGSGGKNGEANYFDGASNIEVTDAGGTAYTGFDQLSKFSFSGWINPDETTFGPRSIIGLWDTNTDESHCFLISNVAEWIGVAIGNNFPDYGQNGFFGGKITEGRWNHVCVVYDGTQAAQADRGRIYIDGLSQQLTTVGTIPAATSNAAGAADLEIGSADSNLGGWFKGYLDELAFWSGRALTATEAYALYNHGDGLFFSDFA